MLFTNTTFKINLKLGIISFIIQIALIIILNKIMIIKYINFIFHMSIKNQRKDIDIKQITLNID